MSVNANKPKHDSDDWYHSSSLFQSRLPGSRGGARVHGATISSWILKGIESPHGRIRLAATRTGSRWSIKESSSSKFAGDLAKNACFSSRRG